MCRVCRCRDPDERLRPHYILLGRIDAAVTGATMKYSARLSAVIRRCASMSSMKKTLSKLDFKPLNAILNFVSFFVGTIMAIGATLGAVNSLYAMVDSRRREIATLRAIGFSPGAVVLAVLLESVLLALPGALLGSALGLVAVQWTGGQSVRLQFSTLGHVLPRGARHRMGAGHGIVGRPATRAARCADAGGDGTAGNLTTALWLEGS